MKSLGYINDDGGRKDAGFRGRGGDCVTRSIAIATGIPYKRGRKDLTDLTKEMTGGLETSAANGVLAPVYHRYLTDLGWEVVITKGQYLNSDLGESGPVIARLPRHMVAIVDGSVRDSWDSRKSRRTKSGFPKLTGYYRKSDD